MRFGLINNYFFPLILLWNIFSVSFGCLAYSSDSLPTGKGTNLFGSSALARGAPNSRRQFSSKGTKCQKADFGVYKATELRRLATIYEFPMDNAPKWVGNGGNLSCNFDSIEENCAWYGINGLDGGNKNEIFRRARFETFFDWEKFDCTNDRTFTFDEFFLIIGGKENSPAGSEISAAIESKIPCQLDKAMLKFDYWSNNETPVLKICVLPENDPNPQCEETKLDANPLTFEIPESLKPFRLRIQVDNVGRKDDIAFIDNVQYEGKLCKIEKSDGTTQRNVEMRKEEENNPKDVYSEEEEDEEDGEEEVDTEEERLDEEEIGKKEEEEDGQKEVEGICMAFSCNFNFGHSCSFKLSGRGSTDQWKQGNGPIGNRHTGIHKGGPNDPKLVGYVFVGSASMKDSKEKIFVMESPRIAAISHPILMTFDLFQRSVGPELKVCLNTFDHCPYLNPSKPNKSKYWLTEQRVILRKGTEKVYFVASKLRQNLYLAIDNIRLQTIDFKDICAKNDQNNNKINRYNK